MKRLTVYAYNEDSGIVGEATIHLLEELRAISDRLIIACNALLTVQGRKNLKNITEDVYCLNSKNMLQVVYADALINYCGIEVVKQYDEVTLINDSVWGPIDNLENIYQEMETCNCDFWRMVNVIAYDEFVVLRKSFLEDKKYFRRLNQLLDSCQEFFQDIRDRRKVAKIEKIDDIYKNKTGYSYITVDRDAQEFSDIDFQMYLVKEKKYPFWIKKIMDMNYFDLLNESKKYDVQEIIKEIQKSHKYDFSLIEKERELEKKNKHVYNPDMSNADLCWGRIYVDYGHGYSEQVRFDGYNFINDNGDFKVKFNLNLDGPIVGFRYDPMENIPFLAMHICNCKCDGKEIDLYTSNGNNWGEGYHVFETIDPYYVCDSEFEELEEIIIEGNMLFVNNHFIQDMKSYAITRYISNIFWDDGTGYSEEHKITKGLYIDSDHEFELRIGCDLKNLKELRYDPIEGFKIRLQLYEITLNNKITYITGTNGKEIADNQWVFRDYDPIMNLQLVEHDINYIYIRGKIEIF